MNKLVNPNFFNLKKVIMKIIEKTNFFNNGNPINIFTE